MAGSSEEYPFLPYNYFDTATSACLADLKQAALARPPGHDMLAELSRVLEAAVISPAWCHPAAQLLANWLDHGAGEPVAGMAHNGLPSRFAAAAGARE